MSRIPCRDKLHNLSYLQVDFYLIYDTIYLDFPQGLWEKSRKTPSDL